MLTANRASMFAPAPTPKPITLRSLLTVGKQTVTFINQTNVCFYCNKLENTATYKIQYSLLWLLQLSTST